MKNFYVLHEGEFKLLGQKKYITFKDGKRGAAENKQYVGQLTLFFQDCPKIYDKVQLASFWSRIKCFFNSAMRLCLCF